MNEVLIKCAVCHREQPESLGACEFCEEMRAEIALDAYLDKFKHERIYDD